MKQWYEELYVNYAEKYEQECFVHGTIGEVDFFEKEINSDKSKLILDIGCGTGRHSLELAKRGYVVTAVDLSEYQIAHAIKKAEQQNLKVDFSVADARKLSFKEQFDLAMIICEGGFSLMETDEMNYAILQSAYNALKKGGKIIFTCLNALFPIYNDVEKFMNQNENDSHTHECQLDYLTFRFNSKLDIEDDKGNKKTLDCNERYFAPSEITWMLRTLGFSNINISGSTLGAFNREHQLTPKDIEMLVVAEKI